VTTWLPAGTPKAMFLVWGDGLGPALSAPGLRAALAATGALRLQVNLDDEHVAGALRFGTGEAIGAAVSVWGQAPEQAARTLVEHLSSAAPGATTAGWLVDERRRVDPAETYDGERADALANTAVLRRPAELDEETWLHRWLVEHTPIAIRTQATTAYLQHRCLAPLPGNHPDPPHADAIVEELFPSAGVHDVHAFYGSGGDDAELTRRMTELLASVSRIGADRDLDLVPGSRHLWDL
jgi:hypothetical protein